MAEFDWSYKNSTIEDKKKMTQLEGKSCIFTRTVVYFLLYWDVLFFIVISWNRILAFVFWFHFFIFDIHFHGKQVSQHEFRAFFSPGNHHVILEHLVFKSFIHSCNFALMEMLQFPTSWCNRNKKNDHSSLFCVWIVILSVLKVICRCMFSLTKSDFLCLHQTGITSL